MRYVFPGLLLAALLLAPAAASAQAPPIAAKTAPRTISIQVAFVSVSVADVDALGINFNLRPLSTPPHTFLTFARGNIVSQLYQTLTRTRGKAILAVPITASDNSFVTIAVDTEVAGVMSPSTPKSNLLFPQLTGSLRVSGKLTLVPHILPGNIVTLDIVPRTQGSQQEQLITVSSGEQIVLFASLVKKQKESRASQDMPVVRGSSGHIKTLPDSQELLLFITPTIAGNEKTPPSPQ